MGLIKTALGAIGGTLADTWLEYFYCEAIPEDVLAVKGKKRVSGRSSNTKGEDNIISNGSIIAVADGQCMIIVDQGYVVELCAEPGEFKYDTSTSPSIFSGKLGASIVATFKEMWERFKFGGSPGKDQRVYYINTKEIIGNKYGTANPVPFRVVDKNIGLDVDIGIKCHGEYSYTISNPILFYKNVCGNFADKYTRDGIDGQLKTELLTALQPAFAQISEQGIRYSALPGHTTEMADALNNVLSDKWENLRGISVVSFGISSVSANKEDEDMIKELQKNAALRDPNMAAAHLVGAQAQAMQDAAKNEGQGAFMAFAGMNMAGNAGMNATNLFQMGQQQAAQQAAANAWTCSCGAVNNGKFCSACGKPQPAPEGSWTCSCGTVNNGKFCSNCGSAKPAAVQGWTCSCGAVNQGKFCQSCGAKKPADAPLYRCDKCGWTPEDPANPPKFCPECGDAFDENDVQ